MEGCPNVVSLKVNDVRVGPCPGIIGQIVTRVIRIFVNHDRVRSPKPIGDVGIVFGSDAKIRTPEPKPIGATAFEAENVRGAEA